MSRIVAPTKLDGLKRRLKGAGRVPLFDALRGAAIVAMVIYHLMWDLLFLGFSPIDITAEPFWIAFQRAIVTAFLLLVGAGLVLGHADIIRWRGFWRRFAVRLGAALLTTIGTYIAYPDYFAYFGILHAIAAFSLVGLAFVGLYPAIPIGVGLVFLLLPAFISLPEMTAKPLSWIGFWPVPPETTDIVPFFPWFGVVLLGIGLTRLIRAQPRAWHAISQWRLDGPIGQALSFMGRWSLLIYLIHQPIMFGALSLLGGVLGIQPLI